MAENIVSFSKKLPNQAAPALPIRRVEAEQRFHSRLEVERQRTDRYGHGFSLLLFDCQGLCDGSLLPDLFAHEIAREVREIDTVGWFDETRLGIILPETSLQGSKLLAEKLCNALAQSLRPTYRIFGYPAGASVACSAPESSQQSHWSLPDEWPYKKNPLPYWKRAVDILASSLFMLLSAPLWITVATGIKFSSGGPVLFKQERVGYRGRLFTLLKFRTMMPGADSTPHERYTSKLIHSSEPMHKLEEKAEGDPRLSPIGRILRRYCLDELPQFFNVLRGEMSLVGPRPCLPYEAEQYLLWHRRRFDSVPGMTGLWQVSGKNTTTFADMLRLDLKYERRRSLLFDLGILLRTIPAILALKQ